MFSIADIIEFLHPKAVHLSAPDSIITDLVFDSRKVILPEKSLFFAIKTEKNDGHAYIEELIEAGVHHFIITQSPDHYTSFAHCTFIQVEDAIEAMQNIAAKHRNLFDIPVIGITGSNGKTIVKEWLSMMLGEDYYIVKNPNSYNSQIGVAVSVFRINPSHELALFEAGISRSGEMERLATIIQPTLGILTNIGSAHSQFFANDEQKLTEKLKLFRDCKQLIYCADNPLIASTLEDKRYQEIEKISWGKSPSAQYQITRFEKHERYTEIELNGQLIEIPFTDAASIENALHTVVCLHLFGYPYTAINKKLAQLTAVNMRMEIKEANEHSIIINDTYSLDLNSLKIALDFLNSQQQYSKKSLIISDFHQSKPLQEEDFKEIARLLERNHLHRLIAVGEDFSQHQHYFSESEYHYKASFYKTTEALIDELETFHFKNEAILIKGARNFRFERVAALLQFKTHQTVMMVNLPAVIHNLNHYRALLQPEVKIVAMVKALSYGLGDAELINELQYHNIDYLAVAYGDEGVRLRKRNIKTPIIVLGAEAHSFDILIHYQLEPEIFNLHYLRQLEQTLQNYPSQTDFKIHIKLDTGMHRLGFDEAELEELIQILQGHPQIKIASVFSHLAAAEDPGEDDFTRKQIADFGRMSQYIREHFNYPILRHILNSAGITRFPEAQFDMVRLGLGLYGFSSLEEDRDRLQHTVTLKSIVTQIKTIRKGETVGYNRTFTAPRDMSVGIVPIGYADGFFRELSNGVGTVIINRKHAPIIGKICMDMCMIDLSEIENVHIGDDVIIYGEENRIDDIADRIQKTPYELLTAISRRVPRIYVME